MLTKHDIVTKVPMNVPVRKVTFYLPDIVNGIHDFYLYVSVIKEGLTIQVAYSVTGGIVILGGSIITTQHHHKHGQALWVLPVKLGKTDLFRRIIETVAHIHWATRIIETFIYIH